QSDTCTEPAAVNNLGHVVGLSGDDPGHAFFWSKAGGIQSLGNLPGDNMSFATAISDADQVIGMSSLDFGAPHAFSWAPGHKMTPFFPIPGGGAETAVVAVNSRGQIAGSWTRGPYGFVYSHGYRAITGMKGIVGATPYGMNKYGTVVGYAFGPADTAYRPRGVAFKWTPDHGMVSLGRLPGTTYSVATAISDSDQVVGYGGNLPGPVTTTAYPFVWTAKSGLVRLPLGPDVQGQATAISSTGRYITGTTTDSSGTAILVLWTKQ
ncbi:MAG TPA: hypothetical protein VNX67_01300, partial [Solirubrobacteraceae bacterium]|nr:hypothetical protein [Solirubrobacteraceae bacterium]